MKINVCGTQFFADRIVSVSLFVLMFSSFANADLSDIEFTSGLEIAAAIANQQAYENMLAVGCTDDQTTENEACSGATFILFTNVRELVHTSNALLENDGPTRFSLDLDTEGLGFALRWTAGEEFASQGTLTSDFVGAQLANLSARLKAIRGGSRGFGVVMSSFDRSVDIASTNDYQPMTGGGASADQGENFGTSRWGGFINGDFGVGSKSPTVFEDAYDFEGSKITFGADYRYDDKWVFGLIGGLVDQEIDFDSTQSVVDGGIETGGYSLMPYALYQSDDYFASASLGLQNMDVEMIRAIKYPSLNPNVDSVNTVAVSSTDASVFSLFLEFGYTYQYDAFVLEPFVSLSHSSTTIDGFSEQDINDDAFDLTVGKQNIDSLETSIGLKLQYAWTPPWGVILPYFDIQSHSQQEKDSRNISTSFSNLPSGALNSADFGLPTDELDSSYYSYAIGVSFVLQGDSQVGADGSSSGSMQGFINYRSVEEIKNFEEETVTLGFRYGF